METWSEQRSTHQQTYRHKLHVPLGRGLQQQSGMGGEDKGGTATIIKTYLLEGLVSNAISNENQRHDSGEEENVCAVRIAKKRPVEESLIA